MKPFQFYTVRRFPKLKVGESVQTVVQMTLFGEGEDVQTTVTMEKPDFEGPLDLLRIRSEIKHETYGFIKTFIDSQRRKLDFTEYLEPVDFQAYYATQKKMMIFQAPKKVCRGVLANLRGGDCGIGLAEMTVDFAKVLELCGEYLGAWFREVSSRVRAAGIHGDQIQQDALFKKLLKEGELSNVTIPWKMDDTEHRVMITALAGVVLVQDYKANLGLELKIVMDVYERLLSKVWEERRSRKKEEDIPVEP
jgi:hypothetical protein